MDSAPLLLSPTVRKPRVTQWIIGRDVECLDYRLLLLPILAWQTNHNNNRWITWVASQFIDKSTLLTFGVNLASLRMIVDTQSPYSSPRLLLTALRNQRSSMVIASLPSLNKQELADLEAASISGNCAGLILLHE